MQVRLGWLRWLLFMIRPGSLPGLVLLLAAIAALGGGGAAALASLLLAAWVLASALKV